MEVYQFNVYIMWPWVDKYYWYLSVMSINLILEENLHLYGQNYSKVERNDTKKSWLFERIPLVSIVAYLTLISD